MKLNVLDNSENVVKTLDLSWFSFDGIRLDIVQQVVSWQLANRRVPLAHTKGISEVRGSTRKIYRQKGRGAARHGAIRAGQFVGGATIFGPQKTKNFSYDLNKKIKKRALLDVLMFKIKEKSVKVHERFFVDSPKTKFFPYSYAKNKGVKVLFIDESFDENFLMAVRNLPDVDILSVMGVNVLDVLKHDVIFISEYAFDCIVKRLR